MRGLVTMCIPVTSGFNIFVGADEATMSQNFAIGFAQIHHRALDRRVASEIIRRTDKMFPRHVKAR